MQPATAGRILRASQDEVEEVSVAGVPMWLLRDDVAALRTASVDGSLRLLPAFDVYTIGNRPRDSLVEAVFEDRVFRQAGWVSPVVLVDGQAEGVWSYEVDRGRLRVVVDPFRPLRAVDRRRVESEAELLGEFLDSRPDVTFRE